MSNALAHHVLVLNKGWQPIGTVTLQRAIIMLFSTYIENNKEKPKATIIEPGTYQEMTWEMWSELKPAATDEVIHTANVAFRIPEIILLKRYEKLPQPKVHFSRRTLYKRDNYTCQYCGKKPGSEELTVEHVIPKAQGGQTTWENTVLACVDCNRKKANRTPKQAGMKLLSVPKKPKAAMFKCDFLKPVKSWEAFLGTAYWNVELQNDN